MEILPEGTLDRALMVMGEKTYAKKHRRKMYEVIDNKYFEQSGVKFFKEFILKWKIEYNVSHFIPVEVKKPIQQVGIEHGFSNIFKTKCTLISESDKS